MSVSPGQASLDDLPCPHLQLDGRGCIVAANAALCRLTGLALPQILGQPFDHLMPVAARVLYQSYLQPLLHLHGRVEEFSLTLRGPPGADDVAVLVYIARRGGAAAEQLDVMLAPIRQRQRIEDEMLRIKRAADHAPGVIFQLMETADGRVHFPYASEAIRRLYGCSTEEGRDSAEAVFCRVLPQDRRRAAAGMRRAAREGRDWRGSYRVNWPAGNLRWHEVQATPRRLAHGVTLWHGHAADVTDRVEMEASVRDREAVERLHVARSEFLARVSHELRTPLNGILGFAQLLGADAADNLRQTQLERVEVIEGSARHLLRLINEVLELTRLESSPAPIALASLALLPQLEAALRVLQAQALNAGVRLQPLDCEPELHVRANAQRLHQVLVNLLANAVKYNRRGGEVRVRARRGPEGVLVDVTDTGPGMSAAQLRGLFQPFNRLGAEHGAVEGSGLGLVISQQLMQRMGGRIDVESEVGAGATFCIRLAEGSPAPADASPAAVPVMPTAMADPRQASGHVLYTEDNAVNAILMEAIIGLRPGVQLTCVRSGAEALAAALRAPPDLLLLDMHLPDTDGCSLLTDLRAHAPLSTVTAIAVSAAASDADIAAARAHGFAAYWTKPLDVEATLAELDRLLGPDSAGG